MFTWWTFFHYYYYYYILLLFYFYNQWYKPNLSKTWIHRNLFFFFFLAIILSTVFSWQLLILMLGAACFPPSLPKYIFGLETADITLWEELTNTRTFNFLWKRNFLIFVLYVIAYNTVNWRPPNNFWWCFPQKSLILYLLKYFIYIYVYIY